MPKDSLINSVGCRLKLPKLIQRLAPWLKVPIPGIKTAISNKTFTPKINAAKDLIQLSGTKAAKTKAAKPNPAQIA